MHFARIWLVLLLSISIIPSCLFSLRGRVPKACILLYSSIPRAIVKVHPIIFYHFSAIASKTNECQTGEILLKLL
jgi:hypothetical protein